MSVPQIVTVSELSRKLGRRLSKKERIVHRGQVNAKLSRKKAQRRKERRGRSYRSSRSSYVPDLRKHIPSGPDVTLKFPPILDIVADPCTVINFLRLVRYNALVRCSKCIEMDHSPLQKITPESVLMLIAEFDRISIKSPKLILLTKKATIPRALHDVLGKSGYLEHFQVPYQDDGKDDTVMLLHESDDMTRPERAGKLVEQFDADPLFPRDATKSIGTALIECMENTVLHAYPDHADAVHLQRRWWLMGMKIPHEHEFSFAFYDQGRGIPGTIRVKFWDKWRVPFLSETNVMLVRRAIEEGAFSRTGDPNRGRGLPTLKAYIDMSPKGELVVITGKVCLKYRCQQEVEVFKMPVSLNGTLIIWRIQS
jgi:hypothetical protein